MEIPTGERIYPDEKCRKCGMPLEIISEAGDEEETQFIGCPNKVAEKDDHTEYNGQPKATLKEWGWKFAGNSKTKLIFDKKTRQEAIDETYRGYQQGVAFIVTCHEDGAESAKAVVTVEASKNWSFQNPNCRRLLVISDDTGHGGYLAGLLGGDISISIPGHEDILQYWETPEGTDAREEYETMEDPTQEEIDTWVEKHTSTGAFYTREDAEPELWQAIVDSLEEDGEYEVEVTESDTADQNQSELSQ